MFASEIVKIMISRKISIIFFLLGLLLCTILVNFLCSGDKIMILDNEAVFRKFNMTRDMTSLEGMELSRRNKKIDSLYILVNDPAYNSNSNVMKAFIAEREGLEKFKQTFQNEESLKIWKRINAYATEFAAQEGYDFIIGLQPHINLIYTKHDKDQTSKFIDYINKKYEGVK